VDKLLETVTRLNLRKNFSEASGAPGTNNFLAGRVLYPHKGSSDKNERPVELSGVLAFGYKKTLPAVVSTDALRPPNRRLGASSHAIILSF
jgi:hypothetical protein